MLTVITEKGFLIVNTCGQVKQFVGSLKDSTNVCTLTIYHIDAHIQVAKSYVRFQRKYLRSKQCNCT